MTPANLYRTIRDILILAAIAFVAVRIYVDGKNSVKAQDFKDLQKQVADSTKTQARWAEESRNASNQNKVDMDTLAARIGAQRDPIVIVRDRPASPGSVPAAPTRSANPSSCPGGTDDGARVDIRPHVNEFELKVEGVAADLRQCLASWPK